MDSISKKILHVEVHINRQGKCSQELLIKDIEEFLLKEEKLWVGSSYKDIPQNLSENVLEIKICELESSDHLSCVSRDDVKLTYHFYTLEDAGSGVEEMAGEGGEDISAASIWILPSPDFHTLWDTLVYDSQVKEQLLNFSSTTLTFSDKGVDPNIITWNKVVLLHGPPGTGKTSLCKALAQKLSIRLNNRFQYGQLIEVNSHSLFSRWFSESGKLVQKLFDKISELVEDPQALVCVLIDEVESLSRSRASMTSGSEPSDALRAVNALLTQLDRIKTFPNVLILTTSNITGTIDLAFVDRADIKHYIGLPSVSAIYQIYHSCLRELIKAGIVFTRTKLLNLQEFKQMEGDEDCRNAANFLWKISLESEGLSGRALRKIPFLAHALFLHSATSSLDAFLEALYAALRKHKEDQKLLVD